MDNQKNKENPQQKQKNVLMRNLIVSIVLIICISLLFWVFSTGAKGDEITYTDLISYIEKGNVDVVELNAEEINIKLNDGTYRWLNNRSSIEKDVLEVVRINNEKALTDNSLKKINLVSGKTTTFSIMSIIFPIIMFLLFMLFMVFLTKQLRGSGSSSMDFVKNRARITPSKTKFTDVAGADEEKEELKEIIDFLKNPDKFRELGARVPKGVLLVGPPGTGKTLLAKACAGEAGVPFFTISGSDFMELFVGVGASRVRDLFANAKKAKPCIIFIDEIDAIGRQRGAGLGGGNDEREQTLNQLLVEMDGFEDKENIIVMAATNRADILDPALMRPGRFDRQIYIHVPDVKGREEILKVHSKNKPIGKDVNLKHVARVTSGFTGADLENLLNESAILAGRANRKEITQEDINNGIVKVAVGPQKKSWLIPESDKKITAYHESGHAVVGKLVKHNNPVHEVSIIPRGGAAGYTLSRPDKDETHVSKGMLMDQISMLLAGRLTEQLYLDDITTGASNDLQRASSLARKMVIDWGMSDKIGLVNMGSQSEVFIGRDYQTKVNYSEKEASIIDEEIRSIIKNATNVATKILKENESVIKNMVELLLHKETIYSDEVDMLINGKTAAEIISDNEKAKENKEKSVDEILQLAEERLKSKKEEKQEIKQEEKTLDENNKEIVETKEEKKLKQTSKKVSKEKTTQNKTSTQKKTKEGTSKKGTKPKKEVSDK